MKNITKKAKLQRKIKHGKGMWWFSSSINYPSQGNQAWAYLRGIKTNKGDTVNLISGKITKKVI